MEVRGFAGIALCLVLGTACSSSANPTAHVTDSAHAVDVTVGSGTDTVPGVLELPAGVGPFPAVVLVAGSGPSDRDETLGPNKPFADLAAGLSSRGIASLRYDKRTLVHRAEIATQLASYTATQEYVPDALAALALLRSRPEIDSRRLFVLGHSQGGTFAPLIAHSDGRLAGIVLWAAANQPFGATLVRQTKYVVKLQGQTGPQVDAQLEKLQRQADLIDDPQLPLDTSASALPGGLGPPYWRSLTSYNAVATAKGLDFPILIQQGDRDYQVTVADDLAAWRASLGDKPAVTITEYPNANHLFIDGTGQPAPAEYATAGHVDDQVIADLTGWVMAQKPN